ncbi:ABC transporter permease [Halobaculum gomorrense]|uniref:Peptide/nickel transport system permease protein/oligopeptide transport system permease protein n=1 Tax=Halobaculum gomorrense TaxID=43928 RepID=A0A1M5M4R0_9EURY|nr:ABC transporter permease [Halobaculum gomorrense]SHG72238.1 peptide/nickel transport system permease protein/oligopeptide transport system permease protein [Halobaculum gomorrense]
MTERDADARPEADASAQPTDHPPRADGGTETSDGGVADTTFGTRRGEFGVGEVPPEYETESTVEEHRSTLERIVRTLRRDRLALAGAIFVLLFVVVAVFAPYVAPHGPEETFGLMKPPLSESVGDFDGDGQTETVTHYLGTDSFGHDLLTRIIYGARVSLLVALATVGVAFSIGTTLGIVAGYYGGWIDSVIMRYVDFQWAFPEIILGVGIIAVMGGLGVVNVVLAIGIAFIDDFARIIRGEVLSIREEEYITAARAVGMGDLRIMFKEMVPNAIAPLIVQATLMIPLAILAEAGLSFLGLGVKPTTPTWGLLISDGRQFISRAPWISVIPGLAIMLVVLAFNTLGDGLRDAFDISQSEVE